MKDFKATLLNNWNFMRWLRLVLGLYIGVQALVMMDPLSGLIALFFTYQAVTNTGCCGVEACAVPGKSNELATEDVQFEEIKSK